MRIWRNIPKKKKRLLAAMLVGSVIAVFLLSSADFFNKPPSNSSVRVLVMADSDDDFRTPPFQDKVIGFDSNWNPADKVADLNICQTVGGGRSLSAAKDGRFLLVCENVGNHLSAYRRETGERLWRLDGEFLSATVASNGMMFALTSAGTIYGDQVLRINDQGTIEKRTKVGGFDLVVDADRKALWLVGANIKKCDLDLNVLLEVSPIRWCAVSVDLNPDGTLWVAERNHPNVAQSKDRLLKISIDGGILKTVDLDFSPMCLRVDHSDGSVWVTGHEARKPKVGQVLESIEKRTGPWPIGQKARNYLTRASRPKTEKRDQAGNLILKVAMGGHTLDINQDDGSIWLAGARKVYQYSRAGKKLGELNATSAAQKYIIVLPADGKTHVEP